jgi:FkbH-like protein
MDDVRQTAAISRAKLLGAQWTFGQIGQKIVTDSLRFGETGRIENYRHANEAAWELNGDRLEIFRADGALMWYSVRVSHDDGQSKIVLKTPLHPTTQFVLKEFVPPAMLSSRVREDAPLAPRDFLFPKDLQITDVKIDRVLLIGSCLTALYREQFSALIKGVTFDHLVFNFVGTLPGDPPAPIENYQFQYIQIPLRTVLSDRVVWGTRFNEPGFGDEIFRDGCNVIDVMLDAAMIYNKSHGMLSFVSNFMVPQMSVVNSLESRAAPIDLAQITRRLNDYLAVAITRYKNAYLADVNGIANTIGKQTILDDMIYFYSHNAVLYKDRDDSGHIPRIEDIPPLESFYPSRSEAFVAAVYDQAIALYRSIHQVDQVKAVVFDLDNTLWRGQLAEHYRPGEAGWPKTDGWPLGIWEAIHYLRARGILVAICSKNDDKIVRENWSNIVQPGFLSLKDFVSVKINWLPKSENIKAICAELSIKPKSVVFVDDNPVERAAVKAALPDIRVIGANPYLTRRILLWAPETQVAHLTAESTRRETMIRSQIVREETRTTLSRDEFLATLKCKVAFLEIADPEQPEFSRVIELTNKTNQFNTTGKRWSYVEIAAFLADGGRIFAFYVTDKFSEYGLVGVLFAGPARIEQFVMSCRVLGMEIERYAIAYVVAKLRAANHAAAVTGMLIETPDNTPCRDVFLRAGFAVAEQDDAQTVFMLPPADEAVFPAHIQEDAPPLGEDV